MIGRQQETSWVVLGLVIGFYVAEAVCCFILAKSMENPQKWKTPKPLTAQFETFDANNTGAREAIGVNLLLALYRW